MVVASIATISLAIGLIPLAIQGLVVLFAHIRDKREFQRTVEDDEVELELAAWAASDAAFAVEGGDRECQRPVEDEELDLELAAWAASDAACGVEGGDSGKGTVYSRI